MVHSDGSQYRIISDEYEKLFRVRNNEQSIPYRYLQLKGQDNQEMITLLKQLFPQHIPTFNYYEECVLKLVDIIYHEYDKRKERSLLPANLTTMQQIDPKLYLFIKNKLLSSKSSSKSQITRERILELLRMEEPSNLNHMIRMVKYDRKKEMLNTPDQPIKPDLNLQKAPIKKKVRFTNLPIDYSCRKKLF